MALAAEADPAADHIARFRSKARRFSKRGGNLQIAREYEALKHLAGPGVVRVYGVCRFGTESELRLELLPYGSLLSLAGRPLRQWLPFAHQAATHLARIHRAGWIHGDVKADHVRFRAADQVCWIDFGSARSVAEVRGPVTPGVADPAAAELASPSQDVYGFGLLLLQLQSGHFGRQPTLTRGAASVGAWCVEVEPNDRPTMDELAAELKTLAEIEGAHDSP